MGRPPELSDPTIWAATVTTWLWLHRRLYLSILNPRTWEASRVADRVGVLGCGRGSHGARLPQRSCLQEQGVCQPQLAGSGPEGPCRLRIWCHTGLAGDGDRSALRSCFRRKGLFTAATEGAAKEEGLEDRGGS